MRAASGAGNLERYISQELLLAVLSSAVEQGKPEINHSGQVVQYAATNYVMMLHANSKEISMATVGEPIGNGSAEHLRRTIKEEEIELPEYRDYHDADRQIGRFLDEVNNRMRIHSSLGYLTPAEFEAQWQKRADSASIP